MADMTTHAIETMEGAVVTAEQYGEAPGEEPQKLTTVAQARAMGFDEDTIDDLLAQGLLREHWEPVTLEDLNWIVARDAQYVAEARRITEQYERRMKSLENRREWLARYSEACQEIAERHLPRKADGSFKKLFLDLEDGRVKLQRKGGGLEVDPIEYAKFVRTLGEPEAGSPEWGLAMAFRCAVIYNGAEALRVWQDAGDDAKLDVLKTPLKDHLKAHPEAQLPGVQEAPVTYEFRIEAAK